MTIVDQKMKSVLKWPLIQLYAIGLVLIGIPVAMAADEIVIELNKLEDRQDACRVYLVFKNNTDTHFEAFKLDLVMFSPDGIIAKRLALDAAPLRANKTSIKLFDIPELSCSDIGRILINDIPACRDRDEERSDCIILVTPTSRDDLSLIK